MFLVVIYYNQINISINIKLKKFEIIKVQETKKLLVEKNLENG